MDISRIFKSFSIYGDFVSAAPYGSGHINDTFAVVAGQAGLSVRYIFQRINDTIFRDPAALMENISRVSGHCRRRLGTDDPDASRKTLTLVKTRDGKDFLIDDDGRYWRCYLFIENAATYDIPRTNEQIYQAARAFGNFQNLVADLPGKPLNETIPDFHNGPKRYKTLLEAIDSDKRGRAASAKAEIDKIKAFSPIFDVLPILVREGKIPVRITHNDTKINNVMIDDATSEGICVIDLDTVMPGLALYDFGDMVRTTASATAEDEKNLELVDLQVPRFEAVLGGYLASAGAFLNDEEKRHLILSAKMITLMIGVRFLTDYLVGDTYFKTKYPDHNLVRCRTQIKLVESITAKEQTLNDLLEQMIG
jgi:Ser/Thr protein kinase RdoA (MazF antagonist)